MTSFESMVRAATGHRPYPWQQRVADEGLPELIAIETGAGKTAGVVLPWLYRRRLHADPGVRLATPHWLVVCLPLRTLVEQTESEVRRWLAALGMSDNVFVHVAMGGRERRDDPWRLHPESDAVVLGTVGMLLSRALNRGYAASRFSWPIDFGLFNNGVAWVLDEVSCSDRDCRPRVSCRRSAIGWARPCRRRAPGCRPRSTRPPWPPSTTRTSRLW